MFVFFFFFSSRRRHTRCSRDWSSDVCSSDLDALAGGERATEQDAEQQLLVDPRPQREHQPGPPVYLVACPAGEGEGLQHAEHPRGHAPHHEAEDQRERDRLTQHRGEHAAPKPRSVGAHVARDEPQPPADQARSEEHTSELQSRLHLVCRLLLEKKKKKKKKISDRKQQEWSKAA